MKAESVLNSISEIKRAIEGGLYSVAQMLLDEVANQCEYEIASAAMKKAGCSNQYKAIANYAKYCKKKMLKEDRPYLAGMYEVDGIPMIMDGYSGIVCYEKLDGIVQAERPESDGYKLFDLRTAIMTNGTEKKIHIDTDKLFSLLALFKAKKIKNEIHKFKAGDRVFDTEAFKRIYDCTQPMTIYLKPNFGMIFVGEKASGCLCCMSTNTQPTEGAEEVAVLVEN